MRSHYFLGYAFLLASSVTCNATANADTDFTQLEHGAPRNKPVIDNNNDSRLINLVYDKFVFTTDSGNKDNPEAYFTVNALKKLKDDYEFDCDEEPCYAFYALRTAEQDSKPGSEDVSRICNIEYIGDGWFIVSYLDMGWFGKTRIKIVDGRIDDYSRCISDKI